MNLVMLALSGCAVYRPDNQMLGAARGDLIQRLGLPTSELDAPEGRILVSAHGPFGKHTYFAYMNAESVMARWTQVLEEKNFDLIKPGMTRNEVVALIGESKVRDGIAFGRGYVWSWRYVNFNCLWFRVEFTADDVVRYTMYQKPPECRRRK